jgi:hypothetical protein
VSTEAIQRAAVPVLLVELPTTLVTDNNLDPFVEEECRKADLDTTMGKDTKSLDL